MRHALCVMKLKKPVNIYFSAAGTQDRSGRLLQRVCCQTDSPRTGVSSLQIITSLGLTPIKNFIVWYVFQAAVHSIWRERDARRHGEQEIEAQCLAKFVDKNVRLWLLSLQRRGKMEGGFAIWFGSRVDP